MGIQERKLREKDRRVSEILDAARSLFVNKGYMNTTMLDIAEKSELSRRTLYLYFKSKDELSYAVMLEAFRIMQELISKALELPGNGYEKLVAMKKAYLDFYTNHFNDFTFTLYFDFKINIQELTDEDALCCYMIIQDMIADIHKVVHLGIRDKSLKNIKDARLTAITAVTIIHATMQKIAVRRDWIESSFHMEGDAIINEMFSFFLSAVKA